MTTDPLACWQCGKIHPNSHLVTLHDGREVGNYSIEWMHECEAQMVCRLETLAKRRDYIEKVREKRGPQAASDLMDRVSSIWKFKQQEDARPQVAINSGSAGAGTPTDRQHGQPGKTGTFNF